MAPFKVGPDFIDPGHHAAVAGSASRNLDGWMLSREANRAGFARHAAGADVAVVEGVMGLYDGFSGRSEEGSTAQMAKWLDLPVLLVVNAASMARSAAAVVHGFETFDPHVRFAGVVFNQLGSAGHLKYLQEAVQDHVAMPCLGGLLREDSVRMPERHLGLVTAEDNPLTPDRVDRLAKWIEAGIDLGALLAGLPELRLPSVVNRPSAQPAGQPVRIGVAHDRAFCFYYPDNLELLEAFGAQLVPFSPMSDACLPADLDGIYLGGGYPELYASQLADNRAMRDAVRLESRRGMPIYGECGGMMYLGRELVDPDGRLYPMSGCLALRTRMQTRLRSLGYRHLTLQADTIIGPKGLNARGHEFHYSDVADGPDSRTVALDYVIRGQRDQAPRSEGYRVGRTLGSYVHLHFGSCPEAARAFVETCRAFRHERKPAG
jgi:cobyrinic acid a,c-diamide synthase